MSPYDEDEYDLEDDYVDNYEEDDDAFTCDYDIDDALGLDEKDIPEYLSDEYLDVDAWYGNYDGN